MFSNNNEERVSGQCEARMRRGVLGGVRVMNVARRCLVILAMGVPAGACEAFVGDYTPDLEIVSETVDAAPFCRLEAQFTFDIAADSEASLPNLEAYYEAANPELIEHLNQVAARLDAGESEANVTYIWGAAGIGKSFVTRNVFGAFDDAQQCTIDLATIFRDAPLLLGEPITQKPDLATLDGTLVFNELPALAAPESFDFEDLLSAGGCIDADSGNVRPLIIIDSIDELQDDSSHAILRAVDEFLLNTSALAGAFTHVVIAGRPGGFASWLTDPKRNEDNNAILTSFQLAAPRYDTTGALEFRLRGYFDFTQELEALETSGLFDAYLASFTAALTAHPFLRYSIGNLSVGNVVIQHTTPDLDESEHELKAGLFDDVIYRNSQSHGRPGDGGTYEKSYLHVLEDIAAEFAHVSDNGTFVVRSEDSVEVFDDDGQSLGEVRVRDVLNRGGVAILTSASTTTARYRFEPFWLHAHLIERRNQRIDPGYDYRGCE